jgi:DNA repair protein RadC
VTQDPKTAGNGVYAIPSRRVADLPSRQRPREQFERVGAENVSDEVLLAILLRSGVRGLSVVELAQALLAEYGSLTALSRASVQDLRRLRGVGKVKAQVLKAALELAQRLAEESRPAAHAVKTPEDAAGVLREKARVREEEAFWVLLLDAKNRLRREPVEITRGLLDASLVHPREVFKEAIRTSCAAVVLAHNHPSGDPTPSAEDIRITRQLVDAGGIVDIRVLDHIILGRARAGEARDFVSLREAGVVSFPA